MSEKGIKFGNKKFSRRDFYRDKRLFKIEDIDINKIVVSDKEVYSKENNSSKYFIGYNDDDDVIRPLRVKLSQMVGYIKHLKNDNAINKTMSFKATNDRLLNYYNEIWKSISSLMSKEFDSDLVYGDKYRKSKIKSCRDDIQTRFHKKGVPRENVACYCLSVIMLESVIRTRKNMFPKHF